MEKNAASVADRAGTKLDASLARAHAVVAGGAALTTPLARPAGAKEVSVIIVAGPSLVADVTKASVADLITWSRALSCTKCDCSGKRYEKKVEKQFHAKPRNVKHC